VRPAGGRGNAADAGADGTRRLFGGLGWKGLFRAWAVRTLLPVCSLGVIPIAREMRRAGVPSGSILAFVLAAPHLNPLSLLYGLTLSEPVVILCFAGDSLVIALASGALWERFLACKEDIVLQEDEPLPAPGPKRLAAVLVTAAREALNPTMGYVLFGLASTGIIAGSLPFGCLSMPMRHDDPWSPALMTAIALPLYCGPLQGMMRLGLMFEHGNSVGAAFALFELGIGVNLGLSAWLMMLFGWKRVVLWVALVTALTLGLAYAADGPLRLTDVEGSHTHAFDEWTSPFASSAEATWAAVQGKVLQKVGVLEAFAVGGLALLVVLALVVTQLDRGGRLEAWLTAAPPPVTGPRSIWNSHVPGPVLGLMALLGLVVFSIVALYIYYPAASVNFEDIARVRAEALTAVTTRKKEEAILQIQHWDLLTRKLQVGGFIRAGRLALATSKATEDFREQLEDLLDALLANDFAKANELVQVVLVEYRKCRESYREDTAAVALPGAP
jgi:uncharacterized membrane protein YraQ (UPF0718 family)